VDGANSSSGRPTGPFPVVNPSGVDGGGGEKEKGDSGRRSNMKGKVETWEDSSQSNEIVKKVQRVENWYSVFQFTGKKEGLVGRKVELDLCGPNNSEESASKTHEEVRGRD